MKLNNLIFILNLDQKTADVVCNDNASGEIYIPKSIIFKSQSYIIKCINKEAFKNSKITSILFPADSEFSE